MNKHQPALRIAAAFALAACFATGAAHAADAARGKQLVESHNCAACHGTKFDNPINAEYPRLAGHRSDYLVWAMRQYQMGLDNPLLGPTTRSCAPRCRACRSATCRTSRPIWSRCRAAWCSRSDGLSGCLAPAPS